MSINRPFLYFLLIFTLRDLHNNQHRGDCRYVNAAVTYRNAFDFMNAVDRDFNYEEVQNDDAEKADIEQQDMNCVPQRVMYRSTPEMEKEGTEVPLVRQTNNEPEAAAEAPQQQQQQVQERSACGPPDCGDNRQDEYNAIIVDTQETINRVTCLIKQMRENALELVSNINELETNLLASCDEPPTDSCGNANSNCNDNSDNNCNDNSNGCGVTNSEDTSNGLSPGPATGVNLDNGYSNYNKINVGANQSPSLGPTPTQVPLLMNEWSAPVKNDVTQTESSKDFMAEAQDAVRSWKAQIDACKQLLDSAVAEAGKNSQNNPNQNQNYVYKPLPQTNNQQGNNQGPQRVQMAPSAAASLTPVVAQHPHTTGSASNAPGKDIKPSAVMEKTSELVNKLKKVQADKNMRTFNGKYDQFRTKGVSAGGWNVF